MAWIDFTEAYVLGAMPSEIRGPYDTWVAAHVEKAGRLAELTGQVVADFRSGLAANPNVEMESGAARLLDRCVPHALMTVFYHLSLEIGLAVNVSAQTGFINAQVYLRRLYTSDEMVDGATVSRSPSYEAGVTREARALTGA